MACAWSVSAATLSPNILAVRLGGDRTATRVVIDLAARTSPPVLTWEGAQLDVDFKSAADEALEGGAGRGLVRGWTLAPGPRGERLRFDLAGDVRVARRFMIPPSDGAPNFRYVIDLAPGVPEDAVPLIQPATSVAYRPPEPIRTQPTYLVPAETPRAARIVTPPRTRGARRLKVVVVDAGHGGHDSGALGATRQEKDLTLAAARTLKTRLERSGRYRVVLTRESDVFIPLETRVKIAREGGADLFISLHADSAGGDAATHGASVYTLSDSGGGRVRSVLGRNEWFAKTANRADAGTSQILLDLTQRSTRNRSAVFADLLLDRLAGKVDLLPRGHRDAGYFVLLAPDVPAALLEMGFITNPDDESRLADPARRARMMDGVAEAIDAYFTEGRTVAVE